MRSANGWIGFEDEFQDERLVRRCLDGSDEAWAALVHKYRNLIVSIPIRYGFCRDDANDILQDVCVTLLAELPSLRDPRTLPAWLTRITSHRCYQCRKRGDHHRLIPLGELNHEAIGLIEKANLSEAPDAEQLLHEAISEMTGRCRELIEMLFFTTPPPSYDEIAQRLGLAKGSIGFTRMRCLQRLRRTLERKGLR